MESSFIIISAFLLTLQLLADMRLAIKLAKERVFTTRKKKVPLNFFL